MGTNYAIRLEEKLNQFFNAIKAEEGYVPDRLLSPTFFIYIFNVF